MKANLKACIEKITYSIVNGETFGLPLATLNEITIHCQMFNNGVLCETTIVKEVKDWFEHFNFTIEENGIGWKIKMI